MLFQAKIIAAALVAGALAMPSLAEARPGGWAKSHPARAHINHRIAKQHVRITHQVRQGGMARTEARSLRRDLHSVRMQTRAYAQANDNRGHLTKPQIRDLNRQLNHTSRAIRN